MLTCAAAVVTAGLAARQGSAAQGLTLEETAAPGANYDKAQFRLWYPAGVDQVQAILVLVPGSNGDGRAEADDPDWQAFARAHQLALVACRFTDKPHPEGFIEEYVDVSRGSGQALVDAVMGFARRSNHPELADAPFLLWGMSAGGEFNYEFTAWKPERVVAFVVNKGNIYYHALVSKAARSVPGILFTGEKDLAYRINTINGLFAVNRRGGALWALAQEPGIGHAVGESRAAALVLYEDALKLRVTPGSTVLKPIDEKSGFIGEIDQKTYKALGEERTPNYPTAWMPTERVAKAWRAVVSGDAVEP
jgi:poly(3-hydroxybutyrate) depolymerase